MAPPSQTPARLAYLTVRWPYGQGEDFLADEVAALTSLGVQLAIIPRVRPNPRDTPRPLPPGAEVLDVRASTETTGGHSRLPGSILSLVRMASGSVRPVTVAKNVVVMPRAIRIAAALQARDIAHIHAHWGTTTATVAYIVSARLGVPWSFTVHRGDIRANNLLAEKARSASFVRCISEQGREWVKTLVPSGSWPKLHVIHMGVSVPASPCRVPDGAGRPVCIAVPARLVEVKGHSYLIEACRLLADRVSVPFRCVLYGEGPIQARLQSAVRALSLEEVVVFAGYTPRARLLELYARGDVDIVALPSITTSDGEHEGIPVALMEAMAHGLPIVATRSGAIGELVSAGCGLLVEEKDPIALADALAVLVSGRDLRIGLGAHARQRVLDHFSSTDCARRLVRQMALAGPAPRRVASDVP